MHGKNKACSVPLHKYPKSTKSENSSLKFTTIAYRRLLRCLPRDGRSIQIGENPRHRREQLLSRPFRGSGGEYGNKACRELASHPCIQPAMGRGKGMETIRPLDRELDFQFSHRNPELIRLLLEHDRKNNPNE